MALHFMGRVELTSPTVFAFHKRTNYDRYNLPGILKDYGLYGLPNWYERNWTRKTIEKELDAGRPVILGCNQGRYGHFILAVGYTDDGRLIINDPTAKAPGYEIGGPHNTIRWEQLLWRGGCIIRPEPFPDPPAVAGSCTESTTPRRMAPGDTGEAVFEVKNTGTVPWPEEVYLAPVEPESTPTVLRRSALADADRWLGLQRAAAPDRKAPAPGVKVVFRVPLRAPAVAGPTIFLERWNLVDGTGRRLGDSYLAGPGDYQMFSKVVVEPPRSFGLPLDETARDGRPALAWLTKAGELGTTSTTPAPPDGLTALQLLSPGRRYNSAWVGDPAWSDYRVEAWVWCEYRPGEEKQGWDRIGIFARDNGDRSGDTKDGTELGESYAMTFDSDDGGVRAGNIQNGGIEDFREGPRHKIKETGWHKFAIRCEGDTLTYELDGAEFWKGKDRHLKSGDCGVYYKTAFREPGQSRGIVFAGFKIGK
jgi:hypothetical protein